MGWQIAARWADEPESVWYWVWQRIADDSDIVIAESARFSKLSHCLEDARRHGFDEDDCAAE